MKNMGSSMLMTLIKSRGESQRSLAELRRKQRKTFKFHLMRRRIEKHNWGRLRQTHNPKVY